MGLLIPQSHQIYFCAQGCLRGVVQTTAEMDAMDRLSWAYLCDEDYADGSMEYNIIDSVTAVIKRMDERPPCILVFLSCMHLFAGVDFDMTFRPAQGLQLTSGLAVSDMRTVASYLDWIPKDAAFPVTGHSLNSKLFSVSDCQKIIKKAVVERLKGRYHLGWFAETGETVQIRFSIMKDQVSLCLDTSGEGLHKRGYRPAHNAAPLRETLAAAMVNLSRYRGRDDFCDPFCGSGTIPIEAALIAKNTAPGRSRHFAAMDWRTLDPGIWQREREAAAVREFHGDYRILGTDIDPKAIAIARANAERAGVSDIVRFEVADARSFDRKTERGVIVTNPPYGERIGEKEEAEDLYRAFGQAYRGLANWQLYLLSSHTEFDRCFGREADKKRKLHNGMIKCDLFMYI